MFNMIRSEEEKFVIQGPAPFKPLMDMSLGKLMFDGLSGPHSERIAMIDAETEDSITYETILRQSCQLACALQTYGYGRDTIMAVCSENNRYFFLPIIASFYIGSIIAPLNSCYTPYELQHCLSITSPKVVFCSMSVTSKFVSFGSFELIVVLDAEEQNCPSGSISLQQFLHSIPLTCEVKINPIDLNRQTALIMCSSGTTGLPKGVMLTHKNVLTRFCHASDPRYNDSSSSLCMLGLMPFYHAFGLLTTLESIYFKQTIVILRKFNELQFLRTIEKYRCNKIFIAPPIAIFLAKSGVVENFDLTCISAIFCGAAPLGKDIQDKLMGRFSHATFRQGYGLTESTLGVVYSSPNCNKLGSSGQVVPYVQAMVRDMKTGQLLGPNQLGELYFKGPLIMKGYYNALAATRDIITSDGWLRTGDLGYYDKEYFFFIIDRIKEIIKYKGFQVAPAELEALILRHPDILDCGVVGVPDSMSGELPLAFVVKHPQSKITAECIQNFVAEHISPPKRVRGGVIFVQRIPKNPSGKILRRQLKALLQKYNAKI